MSRTEKKRTVSATTTARNVVKLKGLFTYVQSGKQASKQATCMSFLPSRPEHARCMGFQHGAIRNLSSTLQAFDVQIQRAKFRRALGGERVC